MIMEMIIDGDQRRHSAAVVFSFSCVGIDGDIFI